MKQKTINRIVRKHCYGRPAFIGKYVYNLAWNEAKEQCYIIRARRGKRINPEIWTDIRDNLLPGWEWVVPIETDF